MSRKRNALDPNTVWWPDGEVQDVISNQKAKYKELVACNRRQQFTINHLTLQAHLPRCPPMHKAAQLNAKLANDLAATEKTVLRQADRLADAEAGLRTLAGGERRALARVTSLEGDIAKAEADARVDYQHYTQQETELKLQIKSLTETKDDIFKNGLGLYNKLVSLQEEHAAAQAATAAAQAATAAAQAEAADAQAEAVAAQAEAAAARADAVRAHAAHAGTDAHADRTYYTQRAEILRLTAQLEAARQYIAPEFADDADDYIREQAQEAVDYVINARKEQEEQERQEAAEADSDL